MEEVTKVEETVKMEEAVKMEDVVRFLAEQLVSDKQNVSVASEGETITITVNKVDMGRIIGKQGRIAKAIRTIVKSASARENKKYIVDIVEVP